FAASDFVLMPSSFEPCGLPQMIGAKYGSIPIARNTGGICDTIQPLEPDQNRGSGFLFEQFDTADFRDAIDRALAFFQRPPGERTSQIQRIMIQAARRFSDVIMNSNYFALYEGLLKRPLIPPAPGEEAPRSFTSPLPVARSPFPARRISDPIVPEVV
ncbi:MAG: hypothetical protein GWO24_13445, partial [Akkermansiaceae bacterium]|nr:hypothetical protein [Akkermansiaceae bacterium]